MEKIKGFFKEFVKEEEGLELSEYALMGALICVFLVAAVTFLRTQIDTAIRAIGNAITVTT